MLCPSLSFRAIFGSEKNSCFLLFHFGSECLLAFMVSQGGNCGVAKRFQLGRQENNAANDHFVGRREMAGVELSGILVSFGSLDSSLVDATDCTDPG